MSFAEEQKVRVVRLRDGAPELDPDNGKVGDEGFVLAVLEHDSISDFDYLVDLGGEAPDAFYADELEAVND